MIALEPFDEQRHHELLARWRHMSHVKVRWGDPADDPPFAGHEPAVCGRAIIVSEGRPVGYLHWQNPTRAELDEAGLHEIPADAVDVDILIGEPDFVGRGAGTRALQLLLERLAGDARVSLVIAAAAADNPASLRAFEKAGFRRLRSFEEKNEEYWLLGRDLREAP